MPNENDDYAGEIEYRLPYLKKHVLNEESLSRLQANDPVLEHLTYSGFFDSDDWIAGTGPAIGNSDVLRMLNVSWFQLSCYRRAIQELNTTGQSNTCFCELTLPFPQDRIYFKSSPHSSSTIANSN